MKLKDLSTRIFHFISFKRKKQSNSAILKIDDAGPVSLPLAGVMYEDRWKLVLKCSLGESVWLLREPENTFDKNAIAVVNRHGQKIGFIGKQIASQIAQYIDKVSPSSQAIITELTRDVGGLVIGAKVGLYLPHTLLSQVRDNLQKLEFYYEVSATGAAYLLLNCDEAVLHQVLERLKEQGFQWLRFGISYREASNAQFYHWYIVLEHRINQQELNQFFQNYFGVTSETDQESQSLDNWVENFDKENVALKDRNAYLIAMVEELKQELDLAHIKINETDQKLRMVRQRKSRRQREDELMQAIQILLPNVEFLRDSKDVITRELRDYQPILQALHTISTNHGYIKADRFEGADGWKELHFSTGQKDDGRIYFKQDGNKWLTLVSFKDDQSRRDRSYLQKH